MSSDHPWYERAWQKVGGLPLWARLVGAVVFAALLLAPFLGGDGDRSGNVAVAGQPGDTVDQADDDGLEGEGDEDDDRNDVDPTTPPTTSPPTTAPPSVGTTGFDSLFIGHSFFRPFASGMSAHAANAGLTDHTQEVVISGGASGSPEGLWDNPAKRAEIQAILDGGDVELFGMTYHPSHPSLTGYRNWVDYALAQNPDTMFFIAVPWGTNPGARDAATYSSTWNAAHEATGHDLADTLRQEYPGVVFYDIPYGQAAGELYLLYDAGSLPDITSLVDGSGDGIFSDDFGHADDILVELGQLVWLRAIYDVDLASYDYDPGYATDLKAIADAILDGHDPAYDAP